MKKFKSLLSILLILSMAFSLIAVSAASSDVTIIHGGEPADINWDSEEVAYIDFSEITEISVKTGAKGHGIDLLPNNGATSWKAANRLSGDGYLLLGKQANTDGKDPEKLDFGNVYIRLDVPLAEKANTPYVLKVDYFGGGTGVDTGSYIRTCYYKASTGKEYNMPDFKYGSTYNSGKVETMYQILEDANLNEKIHTPKGDIRLNTWSGAQLKIRRISLVKYVSLNAPAQKEVRKGSDDEIASFDFSNLTEVPEKGILKGDGLDFYTTQSDGSAMAANIIENGYLLFGRQAHKSTDAEGNVTYANGAPYFKLALDNQLKANTPYAVKIEYFGGGIGLNKDSFIDLRHNTVSNGNNVAVRKTLGSTYNSKKDEAIYLLLPNANLNGSIQSSTCGADFRLETWCGNGTTTGAQMKIKKVSVVKYDPSVSVSSDAVYFNVYSKGDLLANQVVVNGNTGEYAGINWYNIETVKVVNSGEDNFAVQPKYDSNGLGTIGLRFTDNYVKSAKNAKLTVTYWDKGEGKFGFQYNSAENAYTATPNTVLEDSGELKTVTLDLKNTAFNTAMVGSYDIRLVTNSKEITIESIMIESVVEFDVNGDGLFNEEDFTIVRKSLLFDSYDEMPDINSDGVFNIADLVALKKLILAA